MVVVHQKSKKRGHPGKGQYPARPEPKGRQVDAAIWSEIHALVGPNPRRDRLLEYLHGIQDGYSYIHTDHIAALADLMGMAQTEVYEVATFYAHFDVLREGESPPPETTIRVCDSIACQLAGAESLLQELQQSPGSGVRVLRAPCMGRCDTAPVAEVGHRHVPHVDREKLLQVIASGDLNPQMPAYRDFSTYTSDGGYRLLQECLAGTHSVEQIIETLSQSGLRGFGGAGFPAGRKWSIVRGYPGPRLMAVNGDEGEPGTFKDRVYLESDPHRFLEGMLIAAWAVEAETCFLYIRDEYPAVVELLRDEIDRLRQTSLVDHVEIEVRRGAGAYICGEESSMIESIEGKRGLPRNRPPYVAEVGIFGRPTLVNNVETLYWVRDIVEKGAKWFSSSGVRGRKGWRSFSVSGRVNKPGMVLAPAGTTVNELIAKYCGGMQPGHTFKGYLPGGASGGILPSRLGDLPLDFDTLQEYDCFIGSAAVVIFSDQDNMKDVALNLMRFFEDESCGQCTPCRVGTEKAVRLMEKPHWDTGLLQELSTVMADASICGLGQAAGNPILCALKYFQEDI